VRGLLQDVRFALRQLRKNPAYTVAATVMLAVAICANGTVFSWIDGTMLHPIPGARVYELAGKRDARAVEYLAGSAILISRLSRSA
jgi:hypothetical protein